MQSMAQAIHFCCYTQEADELEKLHKGTVGITSGRLCTGTNKLEGVDMMKLYSMGCVCNANNGLQLLHLPQAGRIQ